MSESDKELDDILGKLEASVLHFEAMGEIKGGQDGYDGYMPRVRAEAKQRLNALIEKKVREAVAPAERDGRYYGQMQMLELLYVTNAISKEVFDTHKNPLRIARTARRKVR